MVNEKLRPVVPEDLFKLQHVQSAALSPDGKQAAYNVSWVNHDADKEQSAIWLVDVTGHSLVKFSPAGKVLMVIAQAGNAAGDAGRPGLNHAGLTHWRRPAAPSRLAGGRRTGG